MGHDPPGHEECQPGWPVDLARLPAGYLRGQLNKHANMAGPSKSGTVA